MINGWETGRLRAQKRTVRGREKFSAPCYQFMVCLGEGGSVTMREGVAPFLPMHALLLSPGKRAVVESAEDTELLTVRFDRTAMMTSCLPALTGSAMLLDFFLREKDEEDHLSFLEADYLTPEMISLLEMLVKLGEDMSPEDMLVAQAAMCELLGAVTARCFIHAVLTHDLCLEPYQKVCACMLRNQGRPSLNEVAESCYYHSNTVSRVIRRVTGMGFGDFRQLVRVSFVAKQLRGGAVTVRGSAASCGYSNMTNFYRQFREVYGVSPGEYQALFA